MNDVFCKAHKLVRVWWHWLGIPGLLFALWFFGTAAFQWRLMDRHAEQPGPYRAPTKVAERKRAKGIANAGNIVFGTVYAFSLRRRKIEEEASERLASLQQDTA